MLLLFIVYLFSGALPLECKHSATPISSLYRASALGPVRSPRFRVSHMARPACRPDLESSICRDMPGPSNAYRARVDGTLATRKMHAAWPLHQAEMNRNPLRHTRSGLPEATYTVRDGWHCPTTLYNDTHERRHKRIRRAPIGSPRRSRGAESPRSHVKSSRFINLSAMPNANGGSRPRGAGGRVPYTVL